jgi:hypothetical protein
MSLTRASAQTAGWIRWLRGELLSLDYSETEVWADFRNPGGRVVAHLRPSRSRIVAYLKLQPDDEIDLLPARTGWDFPATFTMHGEGELSRARDLILKAATRGKTA